MRCGVQCFHCCVNIFLCRFRIGIDCCRILICRIECCPGSRSEVIFTVTAVQAQRFIQRALVRQRSRVQTRFTQRAHCRIHCFLISVCVIIYCLCSCQLVGQSLYRRRHVVIQVGDHLCDELDLIFERALVHACFILQARDRIGQIRNSVSDLARRCVIIDRYGLCIRDRILQDRDAFCGVVTVKVTICRFDQCFQLCLRHDLPQLLGCLGQCFIGSFQLIGGCSFIIQHALCCLNGIGKCLQLARTDVARIGQDVLFDELDGCLKVSPQGIDAFTGIRGLHRFAQIEQCGHDLSGGRRVLIQDSLSSSDRCIQRCVIRAKGIGFVDHVSQCLDRCVTGWIVWLADFLECFDRRVQRFGSCVDRLLICIGRNILGIVQRLLQSSPASACIIRFIQCFSFGDRCVQGGTISFCTSILLEAFKRAHQCRVCLIDRILRS